jgi:3-oxoacyl-[acyl-carrier protein] reductase
MKLALSARGAAPLEALAAELDPGGSEVLAVPGDVSVREYCARLISEAESRLGGLDVLINNAGVAIGGKIADTRPEDVETMVGVNFLGTYYCTRFALPGMIERKRGHIVMMDSVAGYRYSPGGSIYSATKFAMRALAEALRSEVQEHNVKVTAIYPGMTLTTYFDPENPSALKPPIPLEELLTAEDVAEATLGALGLPDRVSINTVVLRPTKQES